MKIQKPKSRFLSVFISSIPAENKMSQKSFLTLLFLSISTIVFSQLSNVEEQRIDSIFSEWSKNNGPGVAAGLMFGNDIIYKKGFGLAQIESEQRITTQTKFQIDHLSRQFTVLAILILEQQGKLSFTDPVQKYIPELPEYEHLLTISHLINHSSGLNDYGMTKVILRKHEDDVFTHGDALDLIKTQKELNFIPGTAFSYIVSLTELSLLAEVVAKASEQTLSAFTKEHIFGPLQMQNTHFVEDYNTIISDFAKSYQVEDEKTKLKVINQSNAGPTNLYTSVDDLFIWYKIFNSPSNSTFTELIKQLDQPVKLENGNTCNSSWGIMTLGRGFFHKERGLPAYWQYGLSGGYATNVFRFPEQQLISFVLGNNNRYNGMPAMSMAYHFLENKFPEPREIDINTIKSRKISRSQLKNYEGHYWNSDRGIARKIFTRNDTLYYARLEQNQGARMIPLKTKEKFQLQVESDDKIYFSFKEIEGQTAYDIILGESDPYPYIKYEPIVYSEENLKLYTGYFYAKDLRIVYHFDIEDGKLQTKRPDGTVIRFDPVTKDVFRGNRGSFGGIRYHRDSDNVIIGFSIHTVGIQNLQFRKI
ncbi:serine hydrolase domain-containing protein [Flagellimonas eckloniae]|uniref:Beta-lactamase-related domain-containing protein n=1 Tax=Flagellimonas eckloniae TaxID=346185 RepID=A0A0Q1CG27_9FLAO|nr:serine hydrolase domain-containing protein [Allomuricauda eckloniae]KQC29770.1 hypothetical protein AAY42_07620 [Allomuricauda eckloniae]